MDKGGRLIDHLSTVKSRTQNRYQLRKLRPVLEGLGSVLVVYPRTNYFAKVAESSTNVAKTWGRVGRRLFDSANALGSADLPEYNIVEVDVERGEVVSRALVFKKVRPNARPDMHVVTLHNDETIRCRSVESRESRKGRSVTVEASAGRNSGTRQIDLFGDYGK
jgi:hypothetical protein